MIKKLSALFDVLRKGQAVSNPDVFKSRAKLGNAITLLIGSALAALAMFGHDLPVSGETIESAAYGVAGLWIAAWRVYVTASSPDKGLPAKPNSDTKP